MELEREEGLRRLEIQAEINRLKEAEATAAKQAMKDLQILTDAIADADRARKQKDIQQDIDKQTALAKIEEAKQKAYAETVASIMNSIGPDLVAALTSNANANMVNGLVQAVAPYAIAEGNESVADVANKMLRGLPLEEVIKNLGNKK